VIQIDQHHHQIVGLHLLLILQRTDVQLKLLSSANDERLLAVANHAAVLLQTAELLLADELQHASSEVAQDYLWFEDPSQAIVLLQDLQFEGMAYLPVGGGQFQQVGFTLPAFLQEDVDVALEAILADHQRDLPLGSQTVFVNLGGLEGVDLHLHLAVAERQLKR
jgi:hypothetical protein